MPAAIAAVCPAPCLFAIAVPAARAPRLVCEVTWNAIFASALVMMRPLWMSSEYICDQMTAAVASGTPNVHPVCVLKRWSMTV